MDTDDNKVSASIDINPWRLFTSLWTMRIIPDGLSTIKAIIPYVHIGIPDLGDLGALGGVAGHSSLLCVLSLSRVSTLSKKVFHPFVPTWRFVMESDEVRWAFLISLIWLLALQPDSTTCSTTRKLLLQSFWTDSLQHRTGAALPLHWCVSLHRLTIDRRSSIIDPSTMASTWHMHAS